MQRSSPKRLAIEGAQQSNLMPGGTRINATRLLAPTPEQQNVVLIDSAVLQAQRMIAGCEDCSEDAF